MNRIKILLILLGCSLAVFIGVLAKVGLPSVSSSAPKATDQQQSDFVAIQNLIPKAEAGDVKTQLMVGWKYFKWGQNDPQNYTKAFPWYQKAAAQGSLDAFNALSIMYRNGLGVARDKQVAFLLSTFASTDPDAHNRGNAAFNLAQIYCVGNGVRKDYALAFKYFKIASEAGQPGAAKRLAIFYVLGRGAEQNFDSAAQWFERAAQHGDSNAQEVVASGHLSHIKDPSDPQRSKHYVDLLTLLAKHGFPEAQIELAGLYSAGDDMEKDQGKSLRLFELAAKQGDGDAQYALGAFCIHEPDKCGNPAYAYKWLSLAAEQKNADAEKLLAQLKSSMTPMQIELGEELLIAFDLPQNNISPW